MGLSVFLCFSLWFFPRRFTRWERRLAADKSSVYNLTYEEYLEKAKNDELVESVQEVKEQPATKVSFQDSKVLKNRVAKLEKMLEEAELDLESLRELRYEPEYYQDYQKMEELDQQIDDKHNEINVASVAHTSFKLS